MGGIEWIDKGVIDYGRAWDFQKEVFVRVGEGSASDTVIFCEHPHVYTLGKSGHADNMLVDPAFLEKIGASFYRTDRGGDITYHGYGQLVGYPILNLGHYGLSLKGYIGLLEEAVIRVLERFGVEGRCVDHATGVWVGAGADEKKICAIGVKASRFVTMHGFALNVNTDLGYFGYINPCGFTDKGVTSLQELIGRKVDMALVKKYFREAFLQLLEENK